MCALDNGTNRVAGYRLNSWTTVTAPQSPSAFPSIRTSMATQWKFHMRTDNRRIHGKNDYLPSKFPNIYDEVDSYCSG